MDGDFPWVYVAMIIIAFISWVSNQLKQAAEVRRARMEARAAKARARNEAQPARKTEAPSPNRPITETPAPPALPTSVPQSFRDLLKTIERSIDPPASAPVAPRPIPVVQAEVVPVIVAEKPLPKPAIRRAPKTSLARVLRNQESLRQSIILKEILDPPVSLR